MSRAYHPPGHRLRIITRVACGRQRVGGERVLKVAPLRASRTGEAWAPKLLSAEEVRPEQV